MIPVTIDSDGTVKYADVNKKWYSYRNKEWANAVILNTSNTYNIIYYELNATVLEEILLWLSELKGGEDHDQTT